MDASTAHLLAVLAACIAPAAVWLLLPLHDRFFGARVRLTVTVTHADSIDMARLIEYIHAGSRAMHNR